VIPVGGRGRQSLVRLTRGAAEDRREVLGDCVFVSLVGDDGWPAEEPGEGG
jgi:hypothetical protein